MLSILLLLWVFCFLLLVLSQETLAEKVGLCITGNSVLFLSLAVILKRIIHKKRPPKKVEFFTPYNKYAFPSGHATGLFSITYVIFLTSIPLGIVALSISFFIVIARVKSHVHDLVDIIGGAFIGLVVTNVAIPYVVMYVNVLLLPWIL